MKQTDNQMAVGAQRTNFGLKVEANYFHPQYLKEARRMGNSLKAASTQRTGTYPRVVLQRTVKPRVVAGQQTDTYLKATNTQRMGTYPRTVSQ